MITTIQGWHIKVKNLNTAARIICYLVNFRLLPQWVQVVKYKESFDNTFNHTDENLETKNEGYLYRNADVYISETLIQSRFIRTHQKLESDCQDVMCT